MTIMMTEAEDKDEKGIPSSACTRALTVGQLTYFILIQHISFIRLCNAFFIKIRASVLLDRYMSDS